MEPNTPLCIFLNKDKPSLSETFIKNHIDYLASYFLNYYSYLPRRKNIPNHPIQLAGTRLKNYWQETRLRKILKQYNIKVILAEYGMVGADCYKFCERYSIPLIIHFHGQDAYRNSTVNAYKERYLLAFNYAKAIVVVSSMMKEKLIQLGAPKEKLHVNVYGVDTEKFSKSNVLNSGPILFSAGRFVDKKAPYLVLLAFKKALIKVPKAQLIFAGDGYLYETCKRLVKAFGMEGNVKLPRTVSNEMVAQFLGQCRAFVQHSVVAFDGDSEGTPNTILEAGSRGVPVISTRHAGIKDVVIEGETGLLVNEGDVESMAKHMVNLLLNPYHAACLGNKAREHIKANYSLEKSLRKLSQIIDG